VDGDILSYQLAIQVLTDQMLQLEQHKRTSCMVFTGADQYVMSRSDHFQSLQMTLQSQQQAGARKLDDLRYVQEEERSLPDRRSDIESDQSVQDYHQSPPKASGRYRDYRQMDDRRGRRNSTINGGENNKT
jgi:hypothetical protein